MQERFVFHPGSNIDTVLSRLENNPRGQMALGEMISEFPSLVDALHHTQAVGASTVVHVPDGNSIALVNVPKGEFVKAAIELTAINGWVPF